MNAMLKRAIDLVLASIGLLILLPLLLVVAVLIKLDSAGPVFFRQERVGLHGRRFRIYKFRTMVVGAECMGSRLTVKRDPRVTHIGQLLRWLKIDELPQLINVVRGEMSFIGPRPEDPHFVSFYTPEQRRVLSVRPGVIGVSQIVGRDELESYPEGLKDTEAYYVEHILPAKLARDLEYVATQSVRGDMTLLARGLWITVRGAFKAKALWRWRRRLALVGVDWALIACSYGLAFLIRYDFRWPGHTRLFWLPLAMMLIVRSTSLAYFGAYQGVFAYFGMWDALALFKAVFVSAIVTGGLTFFVGLQSYPRSVFLIDLGLMTVILGLVRYALRAWVRREARQRGHRRYKALVAGAGVGGEQIARALLEDPLSPYRPVGFIDERPERWGALIHGVRVIGGPTELPLTLAAGGVKAVFVCISDLSERGLREIVQSCEHAAVEYRIVPTLSDILSADSFRQNGQGLDTHGLVEAPVGHERI